MISPEVADEIGEMPLQSDMEIEETNSPTDLINIITLPKSNNYNNKGTNDYTTSPKVFSNKKFKFPREKQSKPGEVRWQ